MPNGIDNTFILQKVGSGTYITNVYIYIHTCTYNLSERERGGVRKHCRTSGQNNNRKHSLYLPTSL